MGAADLRARVREVMPRVREAHARLVRIPSLSAAGHDPAPVRQSAALTAELLRGIGAEARTLEAKGGHPAVVGRIAGPAGSRTVLLYAHHDVQPPGPDSRWSSPPFEPVERDGRVFGRGTSDDKAGIAAHLAAVLAHGGKPPCTVLFFIEGEEESGSKHLRGLLEGERERLRCDAVVIADSGNWRIGQPALTTTLRGVVDCVAEVTVLDHAVHSGGYGGIFPDAVTCLARILATLHDDQGRVAVRGIAARDADPLDLTEDELRAWTGARPGLRTIGEGSFTSRMWTRPAISVIGVDAPSVHDSSNQLVPAARARVSMRIPPGQPAKAALDALCAHLREAAPWGAEVKVTPGSAGEPFVASTKGPAYDAMHAALADAWGRKALDIGIGGSIPFLADFAELFPEAELLVTGVGDPSSNAHSEDESLHLADFENVCVAEARFLELFAR
ncbi:MAG TPA: M20/M25/M40 family metallo-hydrolase [Candidatus Limnocylindria bacterium]|nr:M20/M25/M40 family metallo-hydrolase [Candidatus Limnocylindria bacterium]